MSSVEPRILCDSSAKFTPPMAATSLMSLSPTSEEEKLNPFFSLPAESFPGGAVELKEEVEPRLTLLMMVDGPPVEAEETEVNGGGLLLTDEVVIDVDVEVDPAGTEEGGRVMVNEIGAGLSLELGVDSADFAAAAAAAAAAVLACWAAFAFGVTLGAAGLAGRGVVLGTTPALAATIEGTWTRTG